MTRTHLRIRSTRLDRPALARLPDEVRAPDRRWSGDPATARIVRPTVRSDAAHRRDRSRTPSRTPADLPRTARSVRREIATVAPELDAATGSKPLFYALAKLYDGQDHFYRAALNIACGTDPARRDAILADFDKHFPEWNDKVADLVWELRPKSVLPRLEKLLADAKLTAAQKGRIVDILAVNDDPAAGKAMLALLSGDRRPRSRPGRWRTCGCSCRPSGRPWPKSDDLQGRRPPSCSTTRRRRVTGLQLVAAADVDRRPSTTWREIAADREAAARRPARGRPHARRAASRRRRSTPLAKSRATSDPRPDARPSPPSAPMVTGQAKDPPAGRPWPPCRTRSLPTPTAGR